MIYDTKTHNDVCANFLDNYPKERSSDRLMGKLNLMVYAKQIDDFVDTNWILIDRKPYLCASCNSRKIATSILGYPTEEDFYDE